MKILIAAASFGSSISGIQRHAINLARCLLTRPEISELYLVLAPWQEKLASDAQLPTDSRLRIQVAKMNPSSLGRNAWYFRKLPELAAQLDVDLVHLSYPMPINAAAFKCPTVVTLHDMYPYEIPMNFGFPKFIFNRLTLKQCLHNASSIVCVSEATRSRLRDYAPSSVWRKAIHISNYAEPASKSESGSATESPIPGWSGRQFLLCIAQHRRNKNIPLLIKAFEHLLHSSEARHRIHLIVIGIRGPESGRIDRLVRASSAGASIHLLEGISETQLHWCYSRCEVLVAPSITEGFGAPVAEGLVAGCRIVCSDIPAHREIGDGYCRFVSLRENAVEALSSAIAAALLEPKRPRISLPQFSPAVVAKQYIALYRRLIVHADRRAKTDEVGSISIAAS